MLNQGLMNRITTFWESEGRKELHAKIDKDSTVAIDRSDTIDELFNIIQILARTTTLEEYNVLTLKKEIELIGNAYYELSENAAKEISTLNRCITGVPQQLISQRNDVIKYYDVVRTTTNTAMKMCDMILKVMKKLQ